MKFYRDFDLTAFNSYKLKATCKEAYFPETEEDIIDFFKKTDPYIIIGSGHNIILSRQYYDCRFLIFNGNFSKTWIRSNRTIEAESGIFMRDLSLIAQKNGMSGIEVFYDIPSSLGGAVVMNAGASGEEIKDILLKVRYYDLEDFEVKEIHKDDISFEYRNSFFQRNKDKVVLKTWLQLEEKSRETILQKMEEVRERRWIKQPRDYPNAGSVFKRPEGKYVGPMLDELNLKGFRIGGAEVSKKHSGFIVNISNATGKDILDLIAHIRDCVYAKYEILLQVEQRII